MKSHSFVILFLYIFICQGSGTKDSVPANKQVLVIVESVKKEDIQKTATPNPTSFPQLVEEVQKTSDVNNTDPHPLSSESTPKVARHLSSIPKLLRGEKLVISKVKRPFFSSKIPERHLKILKKMKELRDNERPEELSEIVQYAPRSLETGFGSLMNYNNFDLYGNQAAVLPSGTPNSLNHLYLPEFVAKDFIKPVDYNGIGSLPMRISHEMGNVGPYADSFGGYHNNKENNFRGNPIDINYPSDIRQGGVPINAPGQPPVIRPRPPPGVHTGQSGLPIANGPPGNVAAHPTHSHNHAYVHNSPPHISDQQNIPRNENPNNKPSLNNVKHSSQDVPPHDDGPSATGSSEVEGDPGLWSILDLAHMLQNTGGLPEQLLNANNQLNSIPHSKGHPPEGNNNDGRKSNDDHQPRPPSHSGNYGNYHEGQRGEDNYRKNGHDNQHEHDDNGRKHSFNEDNNNGYGDFSNDYDHDDEEYYRGNSNFEPPDYDNGNVNQEKFKPFDAPSPHSEGRKILQSSKKQPYSNRDNQNSAPKLYEEKPNPNYPNDNEGHERPYPEEGYASGPDSPDSPNNGYNYDFDGSNSDPDFDRPNSNPGFDDGPNSGPDFNGPNQSPIPVRNSFHGGRPHKNKFNPPKHNKNQIDHRPSTYDSPNGFDDEEYYNSHENYGTAPPHRASENKNHKQQSYSKFDN